MAKDILVKKDILLPNIPDEFKDLQEVRNVLNNFRQTINEILMSGLNNGILIGDNKIGIGIDNIKELEDLVD